MKTLRKVEITPVFLVGEEFMPDDKDIKENHIYISEHWGGMTHLCLCGCKQKTFMPINQDENDRSGWNLIKEKNGKISITPSVGNFSGENPYHAHYIITNNIANFV